MFDSAKPPPLLTCGLTPHRRFFRNALNNVATVVARRPEWSRRRPRRPGQRFSASDATDARARYGDGLDFGSGAARLGPGSRGKTGRARSCHSAGQKSAAHSTAISLLRVIGLPPPYLNATGDLCQPSPVGLPLIDST